MSTVHRFAAPDISLEKWEQKVIGQLLEATELIAALYALQKTNGFYPSDATREEIELAAAEDSRILDPYTVVERDGSKLIAIPYSVKFAKELMKIADMLVAASRESQDEKLSEFLALRAKDLLRDSYDESNVAWLQTDACKIGVQIGPFDRYHDKLFFCKRSFTAWVGILDEHATKDLDNLRLAVIASQRQHLPGAKKAKLGDTKVRAEHTLAISGFDAEFLFVSNNLPSSADLHITKKHGVLSTIFLPMIDWRFRNWISPIFESLFDDATRTSVSTEDLKNAFLRISILDEVCHGLIRYDDAAERLREYFAYFDEVYGDISAIKSSTALFLKGMFDDTELRAILIAEICQGLYYLGSLEKRKQFDPLVVGYIMFLRFLQSGQGLVRSDKKYRLEFQRAFMAIDELAQVFEYYLALGNRADAMKLLEKFSKDTILDELMSLLKPVIDMKKEEL